MRVHLNLEVETFGKPASGAIEAACDALRDAGFVVTAGNWHDCEPEHADD
jgi:hypothetical protein